MNYKILIIVRHAKSSWEHNVSDVERPLKTRGVRDASLIAKEFKSKNYSIDAVYSSPANRALSTCNIFKDILGWSPDLIENDEELYDFSGEQVINFIKNIDNQLETVVIFGHNHALTSIINLMGDKYIDNLPTSGLVVLKFDIDSWKYAKYGQTELIMFPRDYRP
ncbi:SixA phosphatase family protein [Winogradskyella jejuensis]|uniref:Phosphohistidine phosphatase n=1 Tax=Winogradskyella jejuensis TaxID=1089305 RepID=A0A1M5TK05_9FLAO|nr:histidine phosphatase family protein [Winogradskyella jejuensis]SHH51029.1 phosphohistidine phosphatase [Winogradskyella jejuensis]